MKIISYTDAKIEKNDINTIIKAAKDGWGQKHYEYVKNFEKKFSSLIGSKYSLATSSCTGALTLALASLELKKNSEIILADSNWVASISPIIHMGLKPILVDVDKESWCIDLKEIKKKTNHNTKAIIVTHLYGNVADIVNIKKFCKKKGIFLIEDAAEALGSKYKKKFVGTFGDFGCFSFHGSKIITTGEGGMLVTNNKTLYLKSMILSNHGRKLSQYNTFKAIKFGYKFKLTNIQAALGISQLKRLNKNIKIKKNIFQRYVLNLKKYISFETNQKNKYISNAYWITNIVFNEKYKIKINNLINYLQKFSIQSRHFFPPLSLMIKTKECKNSKFLYNNSINLPSSLNLTKKEIDYVSKKIILYINK